MVRTMSWTKPPQGGNKVSLEDIQKYSWNLPIHKKGLVKELLNEVESCIEDHDLGYIFSILDQLRAVLGIEDEED